MSDLKRTPLSWSIRKGVVILDPDGWDRTNLDEDWWRPITEEDFDRRAARSTTRYER